MHNSLHCDYLLIWKGIDIGQNGFYTMVSTPHINNSPNLLGPTQEQL